MPYSKYNFRPGINREGTDYSNEGGWFDSNLVRFRKGLGQMVTLLDLGMLLLKK